MSIIEVEFDNSNYMMENIDKIQLFMNVISVGTGSVSIKGIINDSMLETSLAKLKNMHGISSIT